LKGRGIKKGSRLPGDFQREKACREEEKKGVKKETREEWPLK